MRRTKMSSSCIVSLGYDPAGQYMDVEYPAGSVYRYFEVPKSVYLQILNAPSIGREWNSLKDAFHCIQLK